MANVYSTTPSAPTSKVSVRDYIDRYFSPIVAPGKDECIVLSDWQPRSDGGFYRTIHMGPDGRVARWSTVDVFYVACGERPGCDLGRLRLGPSFGFMPLCSIAALQAAGSHIDVVSSLVHKSNCTYCADDALVAYMNVLQTLVYQFNDASVDAADLLSLVALAAANVRELLDASPANQRIMDLLFADDRAEDMLQRMLSSLFTRTAFPQVKRLRMMETVLKRTAKHHERLGDDPRALAGFFAVFAVAPLIHGHLIGAVSAERCVAAIAARRALLLERHTDTRAMIATRVATRTGATDGEWTLVSRSPKSMEMSLGKQRLLADATLLFELTRGCGLAGATVDGFSSLLKFCFSSEVDRRGVRRFPNLGTFSPLTGFGV